MRIAKGAKAAKIGSARMSTRAGLNPRGGGMRIAKGAKAAKIGSARMSTRAGLNRRGGGMRIAKGAKGRENRGRADVHTRGAEPPR